MISVFDEIVKNVNSEISENLVLVRESFNARGYLHWPNFISGVGGDIFKTELDKVEKSKIRRDLKMPESRYTDRFLSTISSTSIHSQTAFFENVYSHKNLLNVFSLIASEEVYCISDPQERYVINFMENCGDVHGTHSDSFGFACTIFFESPDKEDGGVFEIAKEDGDFNSVECGEGEQIYAMPGDMIFFRSSIPHRVSSLSRQSRRVVLSMGYSNFHNKDNLSYSSGYLYSD
jgi:predicted 2-oxoglutarate/Fe(II)-dependent dioxygenase YbiX